jgi:hypothetical protein
LAGVDVWFDKADFVPGDYWDRIIQNRIELFPLRPPMQHAGRRRILFKSGAGPSICSGSAMLKFAFPIVIDDLDGPLATAAA